MERKTIHIKRTIDIALSVSESETREQPEQWIDENFIPDGHLETLSADHTLLDTRLEKTYDNQDGVVVVSWPESQELSEYVLRVLFLYPEGRLLTMHLDAMLNIRRFLYSHFLQEPHFLLQYLSFQDMFA